MYLLDTNVISELRRGAKADKGAVDFLRTAAPDTLYLPVQVLGVLRRSLEKIRLRRYLEQARRLEQWLDLIVHTYGDRVLGFDQECAQLWGRLTAVNPQHPIDMQIAAIALLYDLTIVTRNTADFMSSPARLLNPFEQA